MTEKPATEETPVETTPVVVVPVGVVTEKNFDKDSWHPVTALGKRVKAGEIVDIDNILNEGGVILEAAVVDCLVPHLESDLLGIGQSKGKFGGGKRTIWRQTQKKTPEGNKPSFATLAVIGNRDGYVGLGYGKARETVPARGKAIRDSKINIIKIKRGCGSWECGCGSPHSIPFNVRGKCGSAIVQLMPAPKGTGLCIEKECGKVLALAGVKDIYAKSLGSTGTKLNTILACFEALKQISLVKVKSGYIKTAGIIEGNKR